MTTQLTIDEIRAEALDRAKNGASMTNYSAIYSGFAAKGIAESDIKPRENVFTFNAWKAQGRSVKKGEHGVKITTYVNVDGDESDDSEGYRIAKLVTVFHVSQTAETSEQQKQWDANRRAKYAGSSSRRRDYSSNEPTGKFRDRAPIVRDPGEDAADRWNELNGDRWSER
jgi:hypothetical protein